MSDDATRMNRFSLRFAGAELEGSFAEDQARKMLRPWRAGILCVTGIVLMVWALQGVLYPQIERPYARIATPVLLILGVFAFGYVRSYLPAFLRRQQLIALAGMLAISAALIGAWSLVSPISGLLLVTVHILNLYAIGRLRFPNAAAAGWSTAAMYLGYLGGSGALSGNELAHHAAILAAANLFGMIAGYLTDLFARREFVAVRELKLAELELRRARDQAVAATLAKSQFLANMSHELRTPLNAINGFSEVLIERLFGELNAKQDEYVKDIHSSGKHLLSLINDILDLSKVEAGRMELEVTIFHLPSTIDDAMTLVRERAGRHGIGLDRSIDPLLGEFTGDERKFKQIMLNLLSNAIKFTPEGGKIAVTARRRNGLVEVAVADSGAGITPDDLPLIFEEFRQVGTDHGRKAEGTGLGLALTKRFTELHGGSIRVESSLGKGSTFTFTLAEQRLPGTGS